MIKIRRKTFVHTAYAGESMKELNTHNFENKLKECMDFVDGIGYERVANILEYTTCRYRSGDDGITNFVVWYWEEIEDPI